MVWPDERKERIMKCEGTITPLRYEGTHYVKVDKVLCPGCDKIAELRANLEALTKRLEALEPTPGADISFPPRRGRRQ